MIELIGAVIMIMNALEHNSISIPLRDNFVIPNATEESK